MAKVETYTFINAQLDVDFNINWAHNKNTTNVIAMWVDNTGIVRNTTDVVQIVDENNVLISCGAPVTGDNTIILFYDDTATFTGRKLFELVDITNYEDILATLKVAVGKEDTPAQNIPFSVLVEYFQYNLDVLRKSASLSDIPASELPTARANLQVYSISQVNVFLNAKMTVYGGGTGYGLSTTNIAPFTPTQNYHPTTKKYVDDKVKTLLNPTVYVAELNAEPVLTEVLHPIYPVDVVVYARMINPSATAVCSFRIEFVTIQTIGLGTIVSGHGGLSATILVPAGAQLSIYNEQGNFNITTNVMKYGL